MKTKKSMLSTLFILLISIGLSLILWSGSSYAQSQSYLESLTRDRIRILKVWADGIPEGDVCNGSVKTR